MRSKNLREEQRKLHKRYNDSHQFSFNHFDTGGEYKGDEFEIMYKHKNNRKMSHSLDQNSCKNILKSTELSSTNLPFILPKNSDSIVEL